MGRARLHPCRHSPPKLSFRAVRSRACAGRTSEESAFGPPVHYEPIFLHREIRIRARLQPCRHSSPKLSFRAVRNRACAARACPERGEGTREESAFGPPVHDELTFLRKRFVSGHGFSRAAK